MHNSDVCSSLPILLSYKLNEHGKLLHHQTLTLAGNILDVGIGPALWEIVVSIDTVHRPGSVKTLRPEETPASEMFETFELSSNLADASGSTGRLGAHDELRWDRSSLAMLLNDAGSVLERIEISAEAPPPSRGAYSTPGEMLYGLENLRKKRGQETADADEEEPLEEAIAEAEIPVQLEQADV